MTLPPLIESYPQLDGEAQHGFIKASNEVSRVLRLPEEATDPNLNMAYYRAKQLFMQLERLYEWLVREKESIDVSHPTQTQSNNRRPFEFDQRLEIARLQIEAMRQLFEATELLACSPKELYSKLQNFEFHFTQVAEMYEYISGTSFVAANL